VIQLPNAGSEYTTASGVGWDALAGGYGIFEEGGLLGVFAFGGGVVRDLGAPAGGAVTCDFLAIAGAVDVDADGVHGDAVEDGDGEGGIAEIAAPGGELDVGGEGGGDAPCLRSMS